MSCIKLSTIGELFVWHGSKPSKPVQRFLAWFWPLGKMITRWGWAKIWELACVRHPVQWVAWVKLCGFRGWDFNKKRCLLFSAREWFQTSLIYFNKLILIYIPGTRECGWTLRGTGIAAALAFLLPQGIQTSLMFMDSLLLHNRSVSCSQFRVVW